MKPAIVLLLLLMIGSLFSENNSPRAEEQFNSLIIINGTTLKGNTPLCSSNWQALGSLGHFGVYDLISQHKGWNSDKMLAIFRAESHLNPEAINSKDYHKSSGCWGSYGIAQIGCGWFGQFGLTKDNWKNPEVNIRVAYEIWKLQGENAWGAYRNNSYLAFLEK